MFEYAGTAILCRGSGGLQLGTTTDEQPDEILTLEELVHVLPETLLMHKQLGTRPGSSEDPLMDVLRRVQLNLSDLQRYAFIDLDRKYTRNLISTDHQSYTLLLLCWSPGQASPIHDHPCDGCWMRVLHGQVRELRYNEVTMAEQEGAPEYDTEATGSLCHGEPIQVQEDLPPLQCTNDEIYVKGQVAFINDSIGYHQISNPSSELTLTLHLYCPPFEECRTWLDPQSGAYSCTRIGYHSAYGQLLSD